MFRDPRSGGHMIKNSFVKAAASFFLVQVDLQKEVVVRAGPPSRDLGTFVKVQDLVLASGTNVTKLLDCSRTGRDQPSRIGPTGAAIGLASEIGQQLIVTRKITPNVNNGKRR